MPAHEPELSAQVILRSASGKRPTGDARITADTLHEFAPAADTVAEAARAFAALGFEVGPLVGISFSITASPARFDATFGAKRGAAALSTAKLRPQLRALIETVTFGRPPDFGPKQFR